MVKIKICMSTIHPYGESFREIFSYDKKGETAQAVSGLGRCLHVQMVTLAYQLGK